MASTAAAVVEGPDDTTEPLRARLSTPARSAQRLAQVFDDRGPVQRRNDRSGPLQRQETRRVWVDLAVMYPHRSRYPGRPRSDGVDLTARVPGDLLWWTRTTTGEWAGWCCVQIAAAGEVSHVWQYVPAAALSPREELNSAPSGRPGGDPAPNP